jgi:hypothetical protein
MLDTHPFGGGVTSLDAFHCELPVVTLPSAQASRIIICLTGVVALISCFKFADVNDGVAVAPTPSPITPSQTIIRQARAYYIIMGMGAAGA